MQVKQGDKIRFLAYGDDVPEEARLLEEGTEHIVSGVNEEDRSVQVEIENPDFNPKKKESDSNPKLVTVDVFEEEFELIAGKPGRTRPAKAAPAEEDAEGEGEGEEAEEEAPKAKSKAKAPAKAPAKTAAKGKTAPAKGKGKPAKAADEEAEDADPYADLTEDDEDQEIVEMVRDASNILELAQEVVEEAAATEYKLGGVLFHVRKDKAYVELDKRYEEKGGFGLYVSEQLNIEYRKAMYLVDIYYKTNKYGLDVDRVTAIGWSKAARIASVMTEDNAEELLALAEGTTVAELNENIKVNYKETGGTKGEKKKVVVFKFKLFEDEAAAVEETLTGLAAAMGFKKLDDAFQHIVMEWATEHPIKPAAKSTAKASAPAKAAPAKAAPAKAAPGKASGKAAPSRAASRAA